MVNVKYIFIWNPGEGATLRAALSGVEGHSLSHLLRTETRAVIPLTSAFSLPLKSFWGPQVANITAHWTAVELADVVRAGQHPQEASMVEAG